MLDICLLGTGGMMPLPYRWLTALMARYNGKSILNLFNNLIFNKLNYEIKPEEHTVHNLKFKCGRMEKEVDYI